MNRSTPVQNPHEPSQTGAQLSSGLKERLKKCGRYHPSPRSVTNKRTYSENDTNHYTPKSKKQCIEPNDFTDFSYPVLEGQYNDQNVIKTMEVSVHTSHAQKPMALDQCNKNVCTPHRGDNSPLESKCAASQEKQTGSEKRLNFRQTLAFKSPVLKQMETDCERVVTQSNKPANQRDITISNTPDMKMSSLKTDTTPSSRTKTFANSGHFRSKLNFSDSVNCDSRRDNLIEGDNSLMTLQNKKEVLNQRVIESDEKLRKLRMVKMYRSKNDLSDLEKLIDKWRHASQTALRDLHDILPEPRPSLSEFIQHLQIDNDLLQIELEDE